MSVTFEIDPGTGSLLATKAQLFSRKREKYRLQDIRSVQLVKKISVVEEGYGAIWYSLVLEKDGEFVELLSTEDEQEGVACRKELIRLIEGYWKQN